MKNTQGFDFVVNPLPYGSVRIEAKTNDSVIGSVLVHTSPYSPVKIWSLMVDEPYRRKGIATRLMEMAEQILISVGENPSLVTYEGWLVEMYESMGYRRLGTYFSSPLLIKRIFARKRYGGRNTMEIRDAIAAARWRHAEWEDE